MKKIIWIVLAWILCINTFALVTWNRLNPTRDTAYTWIDPNHLHAASWNPLALPERWDSEWYLDIAKNGYRYHGPEALSNLVFFPVYPLLIRVFSIVTLGNLIVAGWLISLAALMGACVMLAKFVREFHPKLDASLVVWFLLLFPTAIFF